MSRVITAFGSFVVGLCLGLSFMLFGGHTSIIAQGPPSIGGGIMSQSEIPVVPHMSMTFTDASFSGGSQQFDGIKCVRCTFDNEVLEYGGGAYQLIDSRFSGPVHVNFRGAAANTLVFLRMLQAVTAGSQPTPPIPKRPLQRTTTPKQTIQISLTSPYLPN
jgi:hypothetical protein